MSDSDSDSDSDSESDALNSSVSATEPPLAAVGEEDSEQDSDDPMLSSLQQEAVNIMQQAEQLRDVSIASPDTEDPAAGQTKGSVTTQHDSVDSTPSASGDGQDPYFHPEDLRDEHLSEALSHAEQYPESDDVSYMDDLDQLSELQAAPHESQQLVEDETTSKDDDNLLDTHALLELHSSLQSSAQAEPEPESNVRDFSKGAVEATPDEDDTAEAIPENPFKLRASKEEEVSQPESNSNQTESHLLTQQEIEEDDNIEEPIDFDVPLHLDGKKVTSASQLDTWSQLIEQAGLTGLPKQIVLHSNYHKDGDQVTLILNPEKKHLVNDANRQTIEEALGAVLQQNISVKIDVGEVKDTPYSVQKAINRVRLSHAKEVIHQDPNVHLMLQHFAASVIEETIKPR
ncbi:MAG: DNA polymerase III subunit gamma/tau C-terminal domain-containing protein [Aestuariibacter sp.]